MTTISMLNQRIDDSVIINCDAGSFSELQFRYFDSNFRFFGLFFETGSIYFRRNFFGRWKMFIECDRKKIDEDLNLLIIILESLSIREAILEVYKRYFNFEWRFSYSFGFIARNGREDIYERIQDIVLSDNVMKSKMNEKESLDGYPEKEIVQ